MSQTVSSSIKYDISTGNIQELSPWVLAVERGVASSSVKCAQTKTQTGIGFMAAIAKSCCLPGHGQANIDENGGRMVSDT